MISMARRGAPGSLLAKTCADVYFVNREARSRGACLGKIALERDLFTRPAEAPAIHFGFHPLDFGIDLFLRHLLMPVASLGTPGITTPLQAVLRLERRVAGDHMHHRHAMVCQQVEKIGLSAHRRGMLE